MFQRFDKYPIGKKLQAINLLIVGLITLLTIFIVCIYMYQNLQDSSQRRNETVSNLLAENVSSALLFGDKKAAQESFAGLRTLKSVTHAELYDKAGQLFASYNKEIGSAIHHPFFDPQYGQEIHFGSLRFDSATPVLSIAPNHERIGTITIQADLTDAYVHLGKQIALLLLIGLVCAGFVTVVVSKLQRSISLPLLSLTETMRKVTQNGGFTERATVSSQDEIGELANVFNHMIDELSHREHTLQQELKERRRIEATLSQIAHFDSVTLLPNRLSFNNQIDRALLNYKYNLEKFALIYIDMDNFKYVNDTFGHHIGDLLLTSVAERLRKSLRQEDFVARLGGDEFVIIMSGFTNQTQISKAADKILSTLQAPYTLEGHEAFIGASIGITICPDNGKDREALQRQADSAMYQAKDQGKNNFQFYQAELSAAHENRINVETQLRRALERNEILVYYQPIVTLSDKRIVGFEALVRWIRQDGVIVRPDDFIPLSEEIGLIVDIGSHVIKTAATQAADWCDRYGPTIMAVNFSSRQFKLANLADDVLIALDNAGLQPANFEMEITESILMNNSSESMGLLNHLIAEGMGIAIDDFGTGYSSLSYITSFPISKIKIDKSFVAKLPNDKNALAVVTAIIGLAKSLNLKVVAEGIETIEQFGCLSKLGCQYGQGFLFSKPVPAVEATQLLELHRTQSALSSSTL